MLNGESPVAAVLRERMPPEVLETRLLPQEVLEKSRNIAAQDASGGVARDVDVKDDELHKVYKDISVMTSLSTRSLVSLQNHLISSNNSHPPLCSSVREQREPFYIRAV